MLQFILGKNGVGKTTLIYNKIQELTESGEKNILMLVPDQISFETEKDFLELLGANKSKNVNVFGFSRLCSHIFDITANTPINVIDKGTRAVIMNIALEQLSEKLTLLSTKNSRSNTSLMLGALSDCKKSNISTEMLRNAAGGIDDATLKTKLIETSLVIDTYDAIVSQSYVDPLDDLTRLYNILEENNNLLQNYYLFIDSFSDFTAQQLKVIRLLMSRCKYTGVALTLDPLSNGREDIFAVSQRTYKTLKAIAKKDFIDIKAPIKLTECKKFKNPELSALESGIFRNEVIPQKSEPKSVMLYSACDTYDECEFVARRIKRLVIENNYLYSDILVICHDTEQYNGIINVIFDKYEIPYFTDEHRAIDVKPAIRLVNSIFRIILDNFERDDVLSMLKTGLTSNTPDEISVFENYTFVWNINNSAFKSEFRQNPRGFADKFTENDKNDLKIAEKVRSSVTEPLTKFKEIIKDKNGREITEALYELLCELDVQTSLSEMYDTLENTQKGLGEEQIKVWSLLMDAFDKTVAVTSDMPLSPKRYFELLSIQISAIEFSQIPQTLDCVTVTSSQRVRSSNNKVSFLIGCTEENFPAVPQSAGFFSPFEIKLLSLSDIKLGANSSELANLELFQTYCCMTSPSEKLFVSAPALDLLGTKFRPSVIFSEIQKVFPDIVLYDRADFDSRLESMLAEKPAFEQYARSLSANMTELSGLREYFENSDSYSSKSRAVLRSLDKTPFKIDNTENAKLLFGNDLRLSASQIEKFSLCRFSYFCNYGLNIRERRKAEINPLEYGTLVHAVLERFFTEYSKTEYSSMTEEEIKAFAKSAVGSRLESYLGGAETKTKSFLYKLNVLCDNVSVLLKHIIKELTQSDFDVADCELKIGADVPAYTVKLPTGENIAVCGSIDRVDVMNKNGEKYIRIVDYKTGAKTFKLSDILYGLNMQMLIYLYALKENGKKTFGDFTPAGILYMPATVKSVSADDSFTAEKIETEIDKNLKMNGLLLDDITVIKGMDKSEKGRYIPVAIKAGVPYSKTSLATLEQFGEIFKKLDMTVISMGNDLFSGKIEASPSTGSADACKYCPYDSVCGYRMSEPRNTFAVDNDEAYRLIKNELSKEAEQ